MKCKLCLQELPLLKKSHIIPNFMYESLRDENNRFFNIDIKKFHKSKPIYTGVFDQNLLCKKCDNEVIGRYETYGQKILFGGKLYVGENVEFQNRKNQNGVVTTHVSGVDYKKFKIFLLSLLWRASISNKDFFKEVALGPHEEIIREMILSGNPGRQTDYPCLISTYLNSNNELPSDIVGQPQRIKNNDGFKYSFLIRGFVYMFFVSKHNIPDWIRENAIKENGEISIPHISKETGSKILNHYLGIEMFK